MNYFEFFNLPIKLGVDLEHLKKRFYENSKKYHPDFFTLAKPEAQTESLDKSTLNNQAYKTLANFDLRIKYFLELYNQLEPEGENQIPKDFLLEMMELNEKLMELEFDYDEATHKNIETGYVELTKKLRKTIHPLEKKLGSQLSEDEWKQLLDFYLKNQYLKRFADNLEKVRPHSKPKNL